MGRLTELQTLPGNNEWSLRMLVCVSGTMSIAVSGITAHVLARTRATWVIWCAVSALAVGLAYCLWKLSEWLLVCTTNPSGGSWEKVLQAAVTMNDYDRTESDGGDEGVKLATSTASAKLIDEKVHVRQGLKYMVASEEVMVCIKGFVVEFSDNYVFEARQFAEVTSEVLETLTEICLINNGKIECVTGTGVFMSFSAKQRTVDAMCVAMYSTKVQTSENFNLTAGIARGHVAKGKVGTKASTWSIVIGGAAHICDALASAAENFGCQVLYAGEIDNQVIFNYAFAQVDLISFEGCAGGRLPIFAVTEGAGVDADISLMWVNVARGDFDGASVLLDQHPEVQNYVVKMKGRLKQIFNAINQANIVSYDVGLSVSTSLNVRDNGIKRTNRLGRFSITGPANDHHAFLVLRMAGTPETPRKLREAMACFCMSVERFRGTVELLLSDRFIARWVVQNNDYEDVAMCSAHLLKVFDGWACGLGLATGRGETIEHRDLTVVCSDARARAECLAMLCFKFGLATVADLAVVQSQAQGVHQPAAATTRHHKKVGPAQHKTLQVEWRVIAFEGTFFIPKQIASPGLVELHRPSNIVYLRAMQQMGEKLWANARELLHQYMEIEEDDKWARELLSVVTTAAHQESVGTRGSDDPLHFIVEPAGGEFYLTEERLQQLVEKNVGAQMLRIVPDGHGAEVTGAQADPRKKRRRSTFVHLADTNWDGHLCDRRQVRAYLGFHAGFDTSEKRGEEGCRIGVADVMWIVHLLCLIADCLITPAKATVRFAGDDPGDTSALRALLIFGYICDAVTICGILRTFYEPYVSLQGILIIDKDAIRKHYLYSWWLALDIVSCVPWELAWVPVNHAVLIEMPWVRCNRIVKILRYPGYFFKVQTSIFPDVHPVAMKLFVNLSIVAYVLYGLGCIWDIVLWNDSVPGGPNSQEQYFDLTDYPQGYTAPSRIVFSFHWALRGFAGYGQTWPTTDRIYAMCIINVVIGIAIFATVIAYLQSMAKMTHNEVFFERLDSIVAVAEHRRLDSATVADILRYHRMLWAKTKQVYEGQFDELKDELPEELVGELAYFANIRAIENIQVLQRATDPPFIAQMISNMTLRFGAPGEQLFSRGDAFREEDQGIYFIFKGRAVATVEGSEIEVVEEGGYWGEISCLLGLPQAADLFIRSYSELYYLPMAGFRKVLSEFPSYADLFVQSASRRRELIRGILAQTQEDDLFAADSSSDTSSEHPDAELFDDETVSRIRSSFCQRIVETANAATNEARRRSRRLSEALPVGKHPYAAVE